MIGPTSHQPSRGSINAADYDALMIPRVHRLIKLGYARLNPRGHVTDEETAITGVLVEAIVKVLDAPTAPWMRFYSIHDDPAENEPKRPGRRRRRGRDRKRVDIRLDSSEIAPRARFRFECKRLGTGHTQAGYLGKDGLGCFLSSHYAREDTRAGMLGYVQSDDEQIWAGRIERQLIAAKSDYSLRPGGAWRHAPVIDDLVHTYHSVHGRGRGRPPIEIYHTLLRFC